MTDDVAPLDPPAALAVSIVNYGTSAMVMDALPPLLEELRRAGPEHRVFIVDNASPDGDGPRLAGLVEAAGLDAAVEVILSPVNGGFAAGNNIAFDAARRLPWRPEAVILHNPDAQVRPGALLEMIRVMRATPAAGLLGPRLMDPDGSTWTAAFRFPRAAGELAAALGLLNLFPSLHRVLPPMDRATRVDWVTGATTVARWDALEDVGDMDDGYFLYYEEIDWARQFANRGWQSWHVPAAIVLHDAGGATGVVDQRARAGRTPDYMFESWARYFAKNHGWLHTRLLAVAIAAALPLGALHNRLRGRPAWWKLRYMRRFVGKVTLARLSPPPASARASGGLPPVPRRVG